MEKLLEQYLNYIQNTKHVSDNTFKSYSRDLKKLIQYLEQNGIDELTKVDTDTLQKYIHHLQAYGYAATTITRSSIAIKSIYDFLCQKGYMDVNPALSILLPKTQGNPTPVLNKAEMDILLNPPVVFSFKGLRDRAMLLVLYNAKIPISELVQMKVSAVDFDTNKIIFNRGMQKKEHVMNEDTREALETYITYRRFKAEDWLFPNRYGNPMSRQGFWKTIKNYTKEIGIEKDITLYSIKQGEL